MCGISGYIDTQNRDTALTKSLISTNHRGPDNTSKITHKINNLYVGIGHNRLSIIDTSDLANQPMISACKNYFMVFNGEIYNYKYLLSLLKNFQPKTSSDSEVLLEFFIQYGINGFKKVNGMFSVVFLDIKTSQLFIFRDPVGIKPIYLYQNGTKIYFSSEIKGLKSYIDNLEIDNEKLYEFFSVGYLIEPETGFKNVRKLMPGCYLQYNLINGAIFEDLYFERDSLDSDKTIDIKTINDSIHEQLMSDVKVGLFFSGGVDSSVVAAATDLDCVYINNPREKNSNFDKKSVDYFKTLNKNQVIEIDSVDDNRKPLDIMKFVAINSEDLISDFTFYSVYRISKYVKENGYKVMLSGMGADEMFLGYPRYSIARLHKYLKFFSPILRFRLIYKILEKFLPNKIDRLLSFVKESNFTKAYFNLVGYYSKKDLNLLLKSVDFVSGQRSFLNKIDKLTNKFDKYSIDSKMWELDRLGFLSHNLMVCDKATMLNSIEMRVPLLNLRIFKKINNNLNSINWKSIFNKKILKKHLKSFNMDYFYKRKKQGFNPDLNRLINSISRKEIEELLIKNNLLNKILDKEYISELISSHYSGKKNNSYKLWQLIFFYYWIEHNTKHN